MGEASRPRYRNWRASDLVARTQAFMRAAESERSAIRTPGPKAPCKLHGRTEHQNYWACAPPRQVDVLVRHGTSNVSLPLWEHAVHADFSDAGKPARSAPMSCILLYSASCTIDLVHVP